MNSSGVIHPELQLRHLRVELFRRDIAIVILDDPDKSANVLTVGLQDDLERCLDFLQSRTELTGVILTSAKPKIFVAGADLNGIVQTLDWPDERIMEFCFRGQRLYNRFREGNFVSVAAIRGACVGGGMELALACDFRVGTADSMTFYGMPEVKLGLIPGWAGTVRLPRTIGLEAALDLVCSGRTVSNQEALALNLIQTNTAVENILAAAVAIADMSVASNDFLANRVKDQNPVTPLPTSPDDLEAVWLKRILANSEIPPVAPSQVAKHMIRSAGWSFTDACDSEARTMAEVYGSPASRGLLNNFFLAEHNRKRPGFVDLKTPATKIETVGLVGLGVMGQAILNQCKGKAVQLIGWDSSADATRIATQHAESDANVWIAIEMDELSKCSLVIEAVVERLDVKLELLCSISKLVAIDSIIATNTSTIPLRKLSGVIENPSRFCGVHFCHPTLMNLVEVVRGESTTDATVSSAVQWIRQLGKSTVVVRDAPGFVVNRILAALLDSAMRLYVAGHSIAEIDLVLRKFGFMGGPFEMIDLIGIDTTTLAGQSLLTSSISQVSRLPLLPRLLRSGRLGRKNLSGFYRYDEPTGPAIIDPAVDEILAVYRELPGESLGPKAIENRILAAMLIAASAVLEEGTAADPRDIDICTIQGLSFPAYKGGLLFWADEQQPDSLASAIHWNCQAHPEIELSKPIRDWVAGTGRFNQRY